MKKRRIIQATLLALCPCAYAQIPDAWTFEVTRPVTRDISCYRGESIRLEPRMLAGGVPVDTNGWAFTAWWSTNGAAWWSKGMGPDASHTVTGDPFVWTPDMDVVDGIMTLE